MIITKYKHNDSHKTIESLSYSLSLLSMMLNDKQASKEIIYAFIVDSL